MATRRDYQKLRQRRLSAATGRLDIENDRYARELAATTRALPKAAKVNVSDADMARMMADYHAKGRTISTGHFPATVTVPDATALAGIKVLVFRSREEADAAGFDWVGR